MSLESTILCLDNSEYSRNGDFAPSRFAAQMDSANELCRAKIDANAESSVGLLTLAGPSARILVTSTRDTALFYTTMHSAKPEGEINFIAGIQKAQLALKHRQNTLQRQRIVAFVSSPLTEPTEQLVRLGKKLKKNNVAVDVINIGLEGDNVAKIDAFVEGANNSGNSRALHVDAGSVLRTVLLNSPIYSEREATTGASGDGAAAGGGDASEFPYGVDPSVDPELAMVLRISMEEERARQAAARDASGGADGAGNNDSSEAANALASMAAVGGSNLEENDDDLYGTMDVDGDEDAEMRRAIELSKADAEAREKKDGEGS